MSTIADKLTTVAENVPKVYEIGYSLGSEDGHYWGGVHEYDNFWDNYQNYGNRTYYKCAFAGSGWGSENFKPKYIPIKCGATLPCSQSMFEMFSCKEPHLNRVSITPAIVDFSEITEANSIFRDSTFDSVEVDFGNATKLTYTFMMGNGVSYGIRSIRLKVTEKCTAYTSTFAYTGFTEEIIFTDDSTIVADINFSYNNNLTDESIQSIINALGTVESEKKVTFHNTVKNKLTDEQCLQIANKNWQLG